MQIFVKLLSGENQTLLIRGNTFLILDLGFHVINGGRRLHIKGDRLSGKGLDENLHSSTETKHQVKSRFLLDVVVRKGATILELLSGENQTLLIRGDTFLILDLGFHVINGV